MYGEWQTCNSGLKHADVIPPEMTESHVPLRPEAVECRYCEQKGRTRLHPFDQLPQEFSVILLVFKNIEQRDKLRKLIL